MIAVLKLPIRILPLKTKESGEPNSASRLGWRFEAGRNYDQAAVKAGQNQGAQLLLAGVV